MTNKTRIDLPDTSDRSQNLQRAQSESQFVHSARNRRLRTPVSATLWALLFVAATLVLTACGNRKTSEPIVEVAPTEVPATAAPATDVPATEVPEAEEAEVEEAEVEAAETEAAETDDASTEAAAAESLESPLSSPDSPLPVADSPLVQKSSAFDSPLVIEGEAQAGFGGIGGRVLNTKSDGIQLAYPLVPIRLASVVLEPQTNERLFILSGAESPGTTTDEEGYFLFDSLEPGDYVMMVGDVIGHHQIITAPDEQAQVYTIEAGEVVNAGLIEVELP